MVIETDNAVLVMCPTCGAEYVALNKKHKLDIDATIFGGTARDSSLPPLPQLPSK